MTATSRPTLDLDISAFRATKRDSVSGGQPIKLRLVVKNDGTVEGTAETAGSFLDQGLITEAEKDAIVSAAAMSACGSKK